VKKNRFSVRSYSRLRMLLAVTAIFAPSASAIVSGSLLTGCAGNVTVTINSIAFTPPQTVTTGTTLWFAGCSGVLGTSGCLSANEGVTIATVTASTPFPLSNYITFAGNGSTHAPVVFNVESFDPGSTNTDCAALQVGQACSVFLGSPITLTKISATSTLAAFRVNGHVTDGTIATAYRGGFSTLLIGRTPVSIQQYFCPTLTCGPADFADTSKQFVSSQSGSFVANPLPTPGTTKGFMTGGGQMSSFAASHGFNLGCTTDSNHNNLEVNWSGGQNFHLESIPVVDCYLDPNLPAPNPPNAGFNSLFLIGTGKLNNHPGATITLLFTDAGEPGTNDMAQMEISFNGSVALEIPLAKIATGNQQAHK